MSELHFEWSIAHDQLVNCGKIDWEGVIRQNKEPTLFCEVHSTPYAKAYAAAAEMNSSSSSSAAIGECGTTNIPLQLLSPNNTLNNILNNILVNISDPLSS